MSIKRIVPNISSEEMEKSRKFYSNFLGLQLVMDMEWILTFASVSNPSVQISVVKKDKPNTGGDFMISIEVEAIDELYRKAVSFDYKIIRLQMNHGG